MSAALICASHSPLMYCYAKAPADWDRIQSAYAARIKQVRDFDPELVIAFGADHYNGFFMNLMPPFCIGTGAHSVGDIGGFEGTLDVPQGLARQAVDFLRANDVDPAASADMTIDHGMSQTLHVMTGAVNAYPTIPVFINCMAEPFVPFRRSRLLGEALGRFAQDSKKRVLFLGSGGMSHHPRRYYPEVGSGPEDVTYWQLSGGGDERSMSAKDWIARLEAMHHEGADMIVRGERTAKDMLFNRESDQRFLDVFVANDLEQFDQWSPQAILNEAGIGSLELHAWIAACAAHKATGGAAPVVDLYTPAPELGISLGILHAG